MTFRESVFVLLLEDDIKQVRVAGYDPDYEASTIRVRRQTTEVIDTLKEQGWTV